MSSLLIIRPSPPVVPQQWNDLVTGVPCVTVGEPRGTEEGEQIISPHSLYPRPPHPTTGPAPERPGQGEEQRQAPENVTPIKLRRLGSRSAEPVWLSCGARYGLKPGRELNTDRTVLLHTCAQKKKKKLNARQYLIPSFLKKKKQ